MDTTDITNRIQDEDEKAILEEQIRATEEDTGYDKPSKKEGLTDEQLYNFRQQNIKTLYAVLYSMGLNTDQVRKKFDLLSQFFGNIGGVSNISDEELIAIGRFLDELKIRNYKFN